MEVFGAASTATKIDPKKARRYFQRACKLGHQRAKTTKALIWSAGPLVEGACRKVGRPAPKMPGKR